MLPRVRGKDKERIVNSGSEVEDNSMMFVVVRGHDEV